MACKHWHVGFHLEYGISCTLMCYLEKQKQNIHTIIAYIFLKNAYECFTCVAMYVSLVSTVWLILDDASSVLSVPASEELWEITGLFLKYWTTNATWGRKEGRKKGGREGRKERGKKKEKNNKESWFFITWKTVTL